MCQHRKKELNKEKTKKGAIYIPRDTNRDHYSEVGDGKAVVKLKCTT
jgi:hypothetical protein